jgi:repressor LexA
MMEQSDARAVLDRLVTDGGDSYAALSRMIRRNDAYLQQFVRRGTPRLLAERDRKLLAAYFRIDESLLGGPADSPPATVAVRLLDISASAGSGRLNDEERSTAALPFDRAMLERLGITSRALAMIDANGESMAPLIEHGDRIMVDEADRRVGARPGVYVVRIDGALLVKRVSRRGDTLAITSDNPDFPPLPPYATADVEVIGRVVWLSRALR